MLKKLFFGLYEPSFHYQTFNESNLEKLNIPASKIITLYIKEASSENYPEKIKVGDKVKTGQKISIFTEGKAYAISTATGTIDSISLITSTYGSSYTAISINKSDHDEIDKSFEEAALRPNLETMARFLSFSPGEPPLFRFFDKTNPVEKIVIYGGDTDLLVQNNFRIMLDSSNSFNTGIKLLKAATGIGEVMLVAPEDTIQNYSKHLEASIKTVSSQYPSAQPLMISYIINGKLPGIKGINSSTACFFKAEAITMLGKAFKIKSIPIKKHVIIIDKNDKKYLINVRIGTHISHILKTLGIKIKDKDKIIFGGPMTGSAIYSMDHPILPDTDLILIQDKAKLSMYSDYPCTNCGECIRICPANVPVNLLVRFLEAGRYDEGADLYDLYSCIECGLCSYVCVSRIPVYQYIKLAKYELERTGYAEELNE